MCSYWRSFHPSCGNVNIATVNLILPSVTFNESPLIFFSRILTLIDSTVYTWTDETRKPILRERNGKYLYYNQLISNPTYIQRYGGNMLHSIFWNYWFRTNYDYSHQSSTAQYNFFIKTSTTNAQCITNETY